MTATGLWAGGVVGERTPIDGTQITGKPSITFL